MATGAQEPVTARAAVRRRARASMRMALGRRTTRLRQLVASENPLFWSVAVAGIALAGRLRLLPGAHSASPGGDSDVFLALAARLSRGDGFAGDLRQPGYPAAIAVLDLLPGRRENAVVILQHLLGVVLAVAVLLLAWRWFGRLPAILAGTLMAALPSTIYLEHQIWADWLFGAVAFAGGALLIEGVRRDRRALLVAAGFVFGLATWIKGEGLFLPFATPVAGVLTLAWFTRRPMRVVRDSAIVIGVAVLTVTPWVVRNDIRYGHRTLTIAGGLEPFNRAFEIDRLPLPVDLPAGRRAAEVQGNIRAERLITNDDYVQRMGPRLTEYERLAFEAVNEVGSFNLVNQVYLQYRLDGMSDVDAYGTQRHLATTAFLRAPLVFVRGTADRIRGSRDNLRLFEPYTQELVTKVSYTRFAWSRPPTQAIWTGGRLLSAAVWLVSLSTLAVIALVFIGARGARIAAASLISLWFVKTLGMAMVSRQDWRYDQHLDAIAWLLIAAAAVLFVRVVRRGVAQI